MRIFKYFAIFLLSLNSYWIPGKLVLLIRINFLRILSLIEKLCLFCIRYLTPLPKKISLEIDKFHLRIEFIDELRFMLDTKRHKREWDELLKRSLPPKIGMGHERKMQLFMGLMGSGQTELAERFLVSVVEENKTDSYNLLRLHNYFVDNEKLDHSLHMLLDESPANEKGRARDLVESIILYYLGRLWSIIDEYSACAGDCGQNELDSYYQTLLKSNGVEDLTIKAEQKLSALLKNVSCAQASPLEKAALYCLVRILSSRNSSEFMSTIQSMNLRVSADSRIQYELGKFYQSAGYLEDARNCFLLAQGGGEEPVIVEVHYQFAILEFNEGNCKDAAFHFFESLKYHTKGVKNVIIGG